MHENIDDEDVNIQNEEAYNLQDEQTVQAEQLDLTPAQATEETIAQDEQDTKNALAKAINDNMPLVIGICFTKNRTIEVLVQWQDGSKTEAADLGMLLYFLNAGFFKESFLKHLLSFGLENHQEPFISEIAEAWYKEKEKYENTPEISARDVLKQYAERST